MDSPKPQFGSGDAQGLELVDFIYDAVGCDQEFTKHFIHVALRAIALFDYKQKAYGFQNVATGGEMGLVRRVTEKVKRLENMLTLRPYTKLSEDLSGAAAKFLLQGLHILEEVTRDEEPRLDSWMDCGVLSLMGVLVQTGEWPGARNLRMVELPKGPYE